MQADKYDHIIKQKWLEKPVADYLASDTNADHQKYIGH